LFHIIDYIKLFKGTVVNRALLSLHGGSLKNTLTIPLRNTLFEKQQKIQEYALKN